MLLLQCDYYTHAALYGVQVEQWVRLDRHTAERTGGDTWSPGDCSQFIYWLYQSAHRSGEEDNVRLLYIVNNKPYIYYSKFL